MTDHDPQRAARSEIIHRYCRMQTGSRSNRPAFCDPTPDELDRAATAGRPAQGKPPIIFDTIEQAQACADELATLIGRQMFAYRCKRSRSGHAHLSSTPTRDET